MSKFVLNSLSPCALIPAPVVGHSPVAAGGIRATGLPPCPATPGFFMLQLQGFPSAATHGYAVLMYAYHRPAQPWPSPSPVRPFLQPVPLFRPSCHCHCPSIKNKNGRSEGSDQKQDRQTTQGPVLKIAPVTQFKCVSLLSARLWLVPPPLATFSMAPLPHPRAPYRQLLIRPWALTSFLLFFSRFDGDQAGWRACVSLRVCLT